MPKLPIRISPGGDKTSLAQSVWDSDGGGVYTCSDGVYTCSRDLRVLGNSSHVTLWHLWGGITLIYTQRWRWEARWRDNPRPPCWRRLLISATDVKQMQRVFFSAGIGGIQERGSNATFQQTLTVSATADKWDAQFLTFGEHVRKV